MIVCRARRGAAAELAAVRVFADISEALVDLHAEGYRVDPGAWELAG